LVLVALSLTVGKEENIPGNWWSYVEEPRYYGLINILTHIGVFLLYQYYLLKRSKKLRYFIISLMILLLPESFRGVYFAARRIINATTEEYSWHFEKDIQWYGGEVIKREKRPGENFLVTGAHLYFYYPLSHYNHFSLFS